MELYISNTSSLTATLSPEDATNKGIDWTSSNNNIVTVDSLGNITANAAGTATIRATSQDNRNLYSECTVIVKTPVEGISLSQSDLSLYICKIIR